VDLATTDSTTLGLVGYSRTTATIAVQGSGPADMASCVEAPADDRRQPDRSSGRGRSTPSPWPDPKKGKRGEEEKKNKAVSPSRCFLATLVRSKRRQLGPRHENPCGAVAVLRPGDRAVALQGSTKTHRRGRSRQCVPTPRWAPRAKTPVRRVVVNRPCATVQATIVHKRASEDDSPQKYCRRSCTDRLEILASIDKDPGAGGRKGLKKLRRYGADNAASSAVANWAVITPLAHVPRG